MRIVLNKEIKQLMRCARQTTITSGKETGFFLYYFRDMQDYLGQHYIFPTELIIGNKSDIDIHSKREKLFRDLGVYIIVCGSFHVHSYKNYLDSIDPKSVNENKLEYIKKCCRNYLSFVDLKLLLYDIIRRDSGSMITCVLSDTEDYVSFYIPKKIVSTCQFKKAYDKFIVDQQPNLYTETLNTPKGDIAFPTTEYRNRYDYIFSLFDENKFDLNTDETIIDIPSFQ